MNGGLQSMAPNAKRAFLTTIILGVVAAAIYLFAVEPAISALSRERAHLQELKDSQQRMTMDLNSAGTVQKTLEELEGYELYPFRQAVAAGVDGVMVAHISYPEIDPNYIASQSEILISDLLRGDMGFEGIVMSDDFRMDGLRSKTNLEQAAVRFILAGGDLILCGANHTYQRSILKGLTDAVASGTISEERLNESVIRLLKAKMKITDWEP